MKIGDKVKVSNPLNEYTNEFFGKEGRVYSYEGHGYLHVQLSSGMACFHESELELVK